MNVLDSPLEAMAFNPVNLGPLLSAAMNNLWAWIAVITAATFSFWRLRPSAAKPLPPPPEPQTTSSPSPSTRISTPKTTSFGGEKKEEEGVLTRGESFKKRFTAYYEEAEEKEERENEEDDEVDGGDELTVVKRWGLTVEIATRDLGWYGFQDRRVIDGSVVRLWEEERENGSRRSPVGVWTSHSPLIFT